MTRPGRPSRLRRVLARPAADWGLAAEAMLALALARSRVALTRFERIAALLSRAVAPGASTDAEAARRQGLRVGRMVARMADLAPFEALCLAQAIAVHSLLRRRGIACIVHFGAHPGTDGRAFRAHAWVTVAGVVVAGGAAAAGTYTEIARFDAAGG